MQTHAPRADCNTASRRSSLRLLVLASLLPLLVACGGGDPLGLYTSVWINTLDAPSERNRGETITVEATAGYFGEISGGDLRWDLNQISGNSISDLTSEVDDNNRHVRFRFTAPDGQGGLLLEIRVRARHFADTRRFTIRIRD
ncbi:MAG: hypothetical protein CGU28_00560 [Candidatus Dactylopiibacterium carminicum]|uniref:Uncharacterized protein n=1 Tax=Candidatus Dactylopiibacterium carminicum TaxID=857335 RepID=A0A272EYW1_9RHOO|nr:hypothetical protein [Candidatus Dactylopiibacterium carminicum]KAF7600813.1 hypothetical protein BGI27_00215 [Candidatus Dactylopiibacterium carminicum]PAS95312.1 MAG: hypothetical protein CGU29_00250 [Candidatus Dactylopiibacterium carminicum]PAS98676.1 MAG: hypothetical protein CGU28_00560 [Candidatus Dactylopiibacterium carminicum]PAT00819.1 MAG: hypothetical protein BSR46_00215 [Candidatus Dactylopiibacterium carminicum]